MSTASRIYSLSAPLLAGVVCLGLEADLTAQDPARDPRCRSDSGTIRTCLVPQARIEGRANIPLESPGCFWLKEDEKEKRKQYKRSANGRPRQFAFQVTNLCRAGVEVRLDLATTSELKFQTPHCEARDEAAAKREWIEISLGTIQPGTDAVTTCDTLPYERKWFLGTTRRRTFRLAATAYDGSSLKTPIFFDPEIVLEKSGHD